MADAPQAGSANAKPRRRFTVDALFADSRPQAAGVSDLPAAKEIRLDRIEPDPDQPRRTFDDTKLRELADSIRKEGVLQPIAVSYDAEADRYVIVHGERRWRASKLAGLAAIPAVVRDVPSDRRLIQQLMENIVRDDLNAVDRAGALRALKAQLGDAPWESVAEAVGIRRSRLFQLLGTEKLPETARQDLRSGRLNEKQSRALQGLPPVLLEVLREAIVDDEIPAAEAMRLAKALRGANLPEDRDRVATELARLRHGGGDDTGEKPTVELLAQVAAAARDSSGSRLAATKPSRAVGGAPYSFERLDSEIRSLAHSLVSLPPEEACPSGQAYASLVALREALAAILDRRR